METLDANPPISADNRMDNVDSACEVKSIVEATKTDDLGRDAVPSTSEVIRACILKPCTVVSSINQNLIGDGNLGTDCDHKICPTERAHAKSPNINVFKENATVCASEINSNGEHHGTNEGVHNEASAECPHDLDPSISAPEISTTECLHETEFTEKARRDETETDTCDVDSFIEHESFIKIAKTFSLAAVENKLKDNDDSAFDSKDYFDQESQDDYVLTDLDSCEVSDKDGQRSKETNIESHTQQIINITPFDSMSPTPLAREALPLSGSSIKEIIHEKIGVSVIDLDHYEENNIVFNPSPASPNTDKEAATESTNFFSAEIHVISCDNQVDFLSEKAPQVVIPPKNSHYMDHSYYQPGPENDNPDEKPCSKEIPFQNSLDVLHPSYGPNHAWTNTDTEFYNGHYAANELSMIFPTLGDYQHSFDENYATMNSELLAQEDTKSEIHPEIGTELDSHSYCQDSLSDSGVFGLSLPDAGSTSFFPMDEIKPLDNYPQLNPLKDSGRTQRNNSMFPKSNTLCATVSRSSTATKGSYGTDAVAKYTHHHHGRHRPYPPEPYTKSASATTTLSSAAVLPGHNMNDRAAQDLQGFNPYVNDYYKHYHNHENYFYQGMPACSSNTYPEWNPWPVKGAPYDLHSGSIPHQQSFDTSHWSLSSTNIRDDVTTPEIVQFLQMEAKEDEEETDDADEFDDVPLTFYPNSNSSGFDHMAPSSVSNSYSDDSCSILTICSPASLTPPPSASSTPVPSSSQDNRTSDEIGFFSPWPTSYFENISPSGPSSLPACPGKLTTEQLETGLLSYGLNQGPQQPFFSMADAMRSSRAKSTSSKKCGIGTCKDLPKRCGRPRKNQIQSDKISTTAMSIKNKKRHTTKAEGDSMGREGGDQNNSQGGTEEVGDIGRTSRGASRHNEPLNQYAIEIMSQWFEDHLYNPYPSKAEKEEMARQGGITENQVKSWFANKRNRTNNTKPKVQKRAMEEKLRELFRDLKRNHRNPLADNTRIIQQLSGIIQHCHASKQE